MNKLKLYRVTADNKLYSQIYVASSPEEAIEYWEKYVPGQTWGSMVIIGIPTEHIAEGFVGERLLDVEEETGVNI